MHLDIPSTGINQCCVLIHCADCPRNLGCGKLVCVYPNRLPFTKMKGAIIYAHVQEHLCVSFDFMNGPTKFDPLMVQEGTKCGPGKVRNPMGSSGNGTELVVEIASFHSVG